MKLPEQTIRILVVEHERRLAYSIRRRLLRAGYLVALAFDGVSALEVARACEWELIVLDSNLPKRSGLEILKELRAQSYTTPVLILSARGAVADRVRGLQTGADDYLVKPFDVSELLARIEAILRRAGMLQVSVLQAGDLVLDVVRRTVRRAGNDVHLSPREFQLLEFLMRNKNHILTRSRIAEAVWGYTFNTGTNVVDVYIAYLRKALNDHGPNRLIHTLPGEGFMLKGRATSVAVPC